MDCVVDGVKLGTGTGSTLREAQKSASLDVLRSPHLREYIKKNATPDVSQSVLQFLAKELIRVQGMESLAEETITDDDSMIQLQSEQFNGNQTDNLLSQLKFYFEV